MTSSPATPARECIDVDPATLVVGDNVRSTAQLDRQFLASLRQLGVMEPIHVTRSDDGTLTVKRGQRRTLGAVKAGLTAVPVLVVEDDDDEADRITRQWHENERRDALTQTDRLAAVEQLTILGVPAGTIARRLGAPKKDVEAAVATSGSDVARAALAKHDLTLREAALIAEFEDQPDVVTEILEAVDEGYAEHVAQRARDEAARQAIRDAKAAELTEAGVTVIPRPAYDDKTIKELREIRLVGKDGTPKDQPPSAAQHAACPGHAAYVTLYYAGEPDVSYVCTDWKANGHALYRWAGEPQMPGAPGGGMTDEQKAERRTLIANNKAWDSAETVRRAWLTDAFLTRTTPPKGAEVFLAIAVAHGEHTEDYHQMYLTLTGNAGESAYSYSSTMTEQIDAAAGDPRRITMLALALIVCAWESTTSRNTWRHPGARDRRYLAALTGWGYTPSDVEQIILQQGTDTETGDPGDDGATPAAPEGRVEALVEQVQPEELP